MAREPITREKPELLEHPGGLEEFAPRERAVKEVEDNVIMPGWSIDRRPKALDLSGNRPTKFVVPDKEEVLIKFIEPVPFVSIWQHWVMTKEGRRPFTCLETADCPICKAGDSPKPMDHFNVIVMSGSGKHDLQVWYATADPTKAIRERAEKRNSSPINRSDLYFAVSKSKASNGFNTYTVDTIKSDDLESDWGIEPLTEEEFNKFAALAFTGKIVKTFTKAELAAVVRDNFE